MTDRGLTRRRLALIVVLVFFSMGAFLGGIVALHRIGPPVDDQVVTLSMAEVSVDRGLIWRQTGLPDDWVREDRRVNEAWYRAPLELETVPLGLAAIYLPSVSQNLAIYLNGVEIGNGGSMESPIARNWPKPLIFPVAPELLVKGRNDVLIRLLAEPPGQGLLPVFYFAPRHLLLPAWRERHALKVMAPTAFAVVQVIFGLLLITITLRRPAETQYGWGGAMLLMLTGHSLPMLMTAIPVSTFYWEWWRHACIVVGVVFVVMFTHRFMGIRRPRLEGLVGLLGAGLLLLGLVAERSDYDMLYLRHGAGVVGAWCVAVGIIPFLALLGELRRERGYKTVLLLASGASLMVFGVHDAMMVVGFVSREDGYLIHFASPFVALVFTSILLSQFVEARREAELLNLDLERRVRDKAVELEQTYAKLSRLEKAQAVAAERERFTRDMHDGLGGYLAGALAMAEAESGPQSVLSQTLRDASDEMRLMLDSMEAYSDDPGLMIGSLRERIERQLQAAGIRLDWRIAPTAPLRSHGPSVAINLIRIIQEAVSNAIRHSGAVTVGVALFDLGPGQVALEITDDGHAARMHREGGRGVQNMRTRADLLGARVEFKGWSDGHGTTVRVILPAQQTAVGTDPP